jgi:4-hydroxy-3-polyprenylbenzoate decarboxylase
MGYATLRACVEDLERHGHLVRIDAEVDPYLELAEIQRRAYAARAPALYFSRVRGTAFPVLANLFGTIERARFVFRDALAGVQRLIELKADPSRAMRQPFRYVGVPWTAWTMLPKRAWASAPVLANQTQIRALPQIVCWPKDGGAFITLPQVYTEHPDAPGPMRSNLGMYRIQLSGGQYAQDREIGLHYQLHRGVGVHHTAALRRGERLPVHVYVGGPPSLALAAVMPLPEGLPELLFAGALSRRGVRLEHSPEHKLPVLADADFCITGYVEPGRTLPEGPFGDHLGYYSLAHEFPVLQVERVYHRPGAIWPFTVVGRPPQEDTTFGALIHEITGPVVPTLIPGLRAVHAVDAAGVHPLLLAIGSERYAPYSGDTSPAELLTQANAILGQNQMSLAKVLLITDEADNPALDIHGIAAYLQHVLERFDPRRDLHFQTETTIDTLDYSGQALHRGSKLVIAARGPKRRELPAELPGGLRLPDGFSDPRVVLPGVLAVRGPAYQPEGDGYDASVERAATQLTAADKLNAFPWVIVCDDSEFCARSLDNFLWLTFTRMNPSFDVHGVGSAVRHKHWGATGALLIDARIKPGHAPPLEPDSKVSARVDALSAKGGPLHGLL